MNSLLAKIFLIMFLLTLFTPSSLIAAAERRTALVIGNSNYADGLLKNPVNDATDVAAALKSLGFMVTLKKNADLREMKDEIDKFGGSLKKRGGVGLFFFAGHGVQYNGSNYLIPVHADISNPKMVEHEALEVNRILSILDYAGNSVNIVMLDACRNNSLARGYRDIGRGLALISKQPPSTLISYATGANQVAADGDGRNSPYTAAFLQNIKTPGLSVEQVFKRVRKSVMHSTHGKQEPAEYTMLTEEFYFNPKNGGQNNLSDVSRYATKSESDLDLAEVQRQQEAIEQERQDLARQKDELERRKLLAAERDHLAAERRKIETERKQISMEKRPAITASGEIGRDGRFIAYSNGTVLDTRTNLLWAAKDNGENITWQDARRYCENYRGGGYSDWRMPTQDELAALYDISVIQPHENNTSYQLHLTEWIYLTACCPWATEKRGSSAAYFDFSDGYRSKGPQSNAGNKRVLPIRSMR